MTQENTDAKSDKTSEEDGKKTDDSATGKDTDTSKQNQDTEKKFTQDDLNALAAKVRKEEKDRAQAAKYKEEKERLEKQAKEQGEFEKLANDRETELNELKPQLESATAEIERYKSTVADIVKAELKSLPEEVREISPAQYAEDKSLSNPLDVLAWLPKGKALAEKLNGDSAIKGIPRGPRATSVHADPNADKQARAQARQAYRD